MVKHNEHNEPKKEPKKERHIFNFNDNDEVIVLNRGKKIRHEIHSHDGQRRDHNERRDHHNEHNEHNDRSDRNDHHNERNDHHNERNDHYNERNDRRHKHKESSGTSRSLSSRGSSNTSGSLSSPISSSSSSSSRQSRQSHQSHQSHPSNSPDSSAPFISSRSSIGPTGPEGPTGPCCSRTVLFWNSGENTPNVDNSFLGWGYTTSSSLLASIIIPYDGTLTNLYAQAPGNSGCTGIATVYVNGVATSLTATGNGTTFSDIVDTTSVNAGDLVSMHFILSGQCSSGVVASVELDA